MPLLFVHGVNTRRGSTPQAQRAFDEQVKARDDFFRRVSFADCFAAEAGLQIENPYWGDFAARFAWELACVPTADEQALGSAKDQQEKIDPETEEGRLALVASGLTTNRAVATAQNQSQVLVTLAREASLIHAVEAITAAALSIAPTGMAANGSVGAEVAQFASQALKYVEANPKPTWLAQVNNDSAFLTRFHTEIKAAAATAVASTAGEAADQALGSNILLSHLQAAANRLGAVAQSLLAGVRATAANVVGDLSQPLVSAVRPSLSALLGRFFGDIFVYLKQREELGEQGDILKTVLAAFDKANQSRKEGDSKLIIVAHSMGGNIMYDILTHYRPGVQCDLFVTVGAQVSLFEEIKLFKASDPHLRKPSRVARPGNVVHWINVFDLTDIFGFTDKNIFDGVNNFQFDNDTLPVLSHSLYFVRPRFHERLRVRIVEVGGAV